MLISPALYNIHNYRWPSKKTDGLTFILNIKTFSCDIEQPRYKRIKYKQGIELMKNDIFDANLFIDLKLSQSYSLLISIFTF